MGIAKSEVIIAIFERKSSGGLPFVLAFVFSLAFLPRFGFLETVKNWTFVQHVL